MIESYQYTLADVRRRHDRYGSLAELLGRRPVDPTRQLGQGGFRGKANILSAYMLGLLMVTHIRAEVGEPMGSQVMTRENSAWLGDDV